MKGNQSPPINSIDQERLTRAFFADRRNNAHTATQHTNTIYQTGIPQRQPTAPIYLPDTWYHGLSPPPCCGYSGLLCACRRCRNLRTVCCSRPQDGDGGDDHSSRLQLRRLHAPVDPYRHGAQVHRGQGYILQPMPQGLWITDCRAGCGLQWSRSRGESRAQIVKT